MERIIGYDKDGKKIVEDMGFSRGSGLCWAEQDRRSNITKNLIEKTEDMSNKKRKQYLNGVLKKQYSSKSFKHRELRNMRIK